MKKILAFCCCLAAASFVSAEDSPSSSAIPPKIPVRDFFKNPESRGYLLSPDGKTLSYLAPWESRMNIWVRPTAGGEAKRITSEKDRDIRDYSWKGNQCVIYAQDNKCDENFHLFRVDLKSGEVKDLTPFPKVRAGLIDDLEDNSATDILITLNKRNPELFDAVRVNVATGEMKVAAENPGHVDSWVTDHKGRVLAATETDGVNATLLTRSDEKAPFKKVLTTNFREHLAPQFYTFDNKELYVASNIGRDKLPMSTWMRSRFPRSEKLSPMSLTPHGRNNGNISIQKQRKCLRPSRKSYRGFRSMAPETITMRINLSSWRRMIARRDFAICLTRKPAS
jgi:dipeptidyl aminopeptidase/acylaminoacyl peptidase